MIEGLPKELQDYLERVAEEIRGGGPPPKHIPLPERWMTLLCRVDVAAARHIHDPNRSLYQIGRYEVLRATGRGAFGLVFEAIDPLLGRRVALKLCEVCDEETALRVLNEAQLLARVSHPNVITVHDISAHEKDLVIVMEFATGKTAHHFASSGPPWQEILDVYLGAGAGLAAAHGEKVIHGDFKPDNVLVDEGGSRPRVADFGFARLRLEHTPEHEREQVRARGVRGFAAPEVLRGHDCDALSDQWSFCASVWRSLEGALPFEAESTDRMLELIEQTRPRRVKATVPETVRAVLERGLSMDPADRFPSMQALVEALELVRHTAVTPPQVSPEERLELMLRPPERRRRKGPGWGPFTAAVLFAAVSLAVSASQRLSADQTTRGKGVRLLETDPHLPSESACAVTRAEKDHRVPAVVEGVCRTIRLGDVKGAHDMWSGIYEDRLLENSGPEGEETQAGEGEPAEGEGTEGQPGEGEPVVESPTEDEAPDVALALDSLIVARTFVSQAETFLFAGRHTDATDAQQRALSWSTKAASTLGNEHAGVRWVLLRQDLVRTLVQSQD